MISERPKLTLKINPALQAKLKASNVIIEKIEKREEVKVDQDKKVKPKTSLPKKKYLLENKEYKRILLIMQESYPNCFTTPAKPLALSIHKSLIFEKSDALSKNTIRRFLSTYCRHRDYKKILKLGSDRVDLQGYVTGQVTKEELENNKKE